MSGRVTDEDIEAFLRALREKPETAEEVSAAARVMREHALKLSRAFPEALDTCGTGADNQHTVNVSTLAAIVAAAAGVRVAKHGNRSVTSVCGSADLLELLGVKIDLTPPVVEACLEKTGFGFFFAPIFHPAVKYAGAARKQIKGKTIFNLLGPLSNPAGAGTQLIGVWDPPHVELVAQALVQFGTKRAFVVHGLDGLDEISLSAETLVAEVRNGNIQTFHLDPSNLGFKKCEISALQCSTKEQCKDAALAILQGADGPQTEFVVLNAGAALCVAGKAPSIPEGARVARAVLKSGAALKKLEEIIEVSRV